MASLLSPRTINRSLLALPPHLRSFTYNNARAFSSTHSQKIDLVSLAVAGPNLILDSIHSLGIPWHTTIPLTAILARTTLIYYLSVRPSRRKRELYNHLTPLTHAHVIRHMNSDTERNRRRQMREENQSEGARRFDASLTRFFAFWRERRKLASAYGAGPPVPWSLVNFGMLIAFTEAIRLKCGRQEGLLSMILGPFQWINDKLQGTEGIGMRVGEQVNRDPAEILAAKLEASRAAHVASQEQAALAQAPSGMNPNIDTILLTGDDLQQSANVAQADIIQQAAIDPTSPYFDPTLQTEGLAWCTNLTLPDPTFSLSLIFCATVTTSVILRSRASTYTPNITSSTTATSTNPSTRSYLRITNGQRITILFMWLLSLGSVNMPAGIVLYLTSGLAAGFLQQGWLERRRPIVPAIQPCRRPVRMKVKRGF